MSVFCARDFRYFNLGSSYLHLILCFGGCAEAAEVLGNWDLFQNSVIWLWTQR